MNDLAQFTQDEKMFDETLLQVLLRIYKECPLYIYSDGNREMIALEWIYQIKTHEPQKFDELAQWIDNGLENTVYLIGNNGDKPSPYLFCVEKREF